MIVGDAPLMRWTWIGRKRLLKILYDLVTMHFIQSAHAADPGTRSPRLATEIVLCFKI